MSPLYCACGCGTEVDPDTGWIGVDGISVYVSMEHEIDAESDKADHAADAEHDATVSANIDARREL